VYRNILKLLYDGAKLQEVLFGRVLELHADVDVSHAEPVNSRRFIRQRLR